MKRVLIKPRDAQTVEVRVAQIDPEDSHFRVVHLPDRDLQVRWLPTAGGGGRIELDGRRYSCEVVRDGAHIEVWIDGRVRSFVIDSGTARRSGSAAQVGASEVLSAPMPGTVLKIDIAEGQAFEAHQPLLIMESMKMEMTLSFPHAGVVKSIDCATGDLVERGATLIQLEDPDDDPDGDSDAAD